VRYCTLAVTDVAAFSVRLQLFCLAPPLEQPPDQMASRPLLTVSVTTVPVAKLALPVVPTLTLSPTGLEESDSPERPVAVTLSWVVDAVVPLPQTLATPPPPQVWGAVQEPQGSMLPQPSEIVPQFVPCAAQVVGLQVAVVKKSAFCCETPPEAAVITTED
jgi:hypothetical protein